MGETKQMSSVELNKTFNYTIENYGFGNYPMKFVEKYGRMVDHSLILLKVGLQKTIP